MAESVNDDEKIMVSKEDFDGLVRQVNTLQSVVMELQKNQTEMRKTLIPTIQQVMSWHEHRGNGEILWTRIPKEIIEKQEEARQASIAAQGKPQQRGK